MKTDDSSITLNASGGMSFNGNDATQFYRARTLASGLKMYAAHGIIPTRGATITWMLKAATGYTGKAYKRGEALKAYADLKVWCDVMLAALPIEQKP